MKEFICINCPMGCNLIVDDSDLNNIKVTGNTCKRGETYGINEVLHPKRVVTSVIRIDNRKEVLSVKTNDGIPKEKIFEVLDLLKETEAHAPVNIGDVIISDILGTGVSLVATKNIR